MIILRSLHQSNLLEIQTFRQQNCQNGIHSKARIPDAARGLTENRLLTGALKTRNRLGNFGTGSGMINGDKPRASHGSSIGPGFGSAGGAWNGGIWGTTIGSGLKSGPNDNPRSQGQF